MIRKFIFKGFYYFFVLILFRYIYYGAIGGLQALGDVYPKEIIPVLAKQASDTSRSVEQRLKVNEALLIISKRCGDTLSFHGTVNFFIFSFFIF